MGERERKCYLLAGPSLWCNYFVQTNGSGWMFERVRPPRARMMMENTVARGLLVAISISQPRPGGRTEWSAHT